MIDRVYSLNIPKSHLDQIFDALLDHKTARVALPVMRNIQEQMAEQAEQAKEAVDGDNG